QSSTPRELDDAYMAAMYNEIKIHPQFQLEPYYIGIYRKWIPASTSPYPGLPIPPKARDRQRDNLHTIGLRITNKTVNGKSASPLFDYSLEGAYQTGFNGQRVQAGWDLLNLRDSNGDPIYTERQRYDAYVLYADVGYRPVEFLRIGLMADLASGDPDRTDASVATYNQLFPSNHGPMGDMDLIGSRNMIARAIRLDLSFGQYGELKLAYWNYRKHKAQDSYYDNGGNAATDEDGELLSTETSSNSRYGEVLDANGKISENSVAQLSAALFDEYNVTYAIKANGLKFAFGYGQAYARSSIRHRVDETYVRPDLREPAFDPRSDFAYFMLTAEF
ncbi:MAG: alginate export family protein, partial [Leptospiraceae bacterium]|nr:alginate export family protein [Leptospiraceae bacterium]